MLMLNDIRFAYLYNIYNNYKNFVSQYTRQCDCLFHSLDSRATVPDLCREEC